MKQSFASVAGLRGGGPILGSVRDQGCVRVPAPRITIAAAPPCAADAELVRPADQANAVRSLTPGGISPSLTSRHKAMRSLRASATIMVVLRSVAGLRGGGP